MQEKDVLGYCHFNKYIWTCNPIVIPETNVIEQLSSRRQVAKIEESELDKLKIALITNKGCIEAPPSTFSRILQDDRIMIFSHYPPIEVKTKLVLEQAFLLTPGDRIIISMMFNKQVNLSKDEIYRPDHYFFIY